MYNARLSCLLFLFVFNTLALVSANTDEENKPALPPGLLRPDIVKLPLVQSRWLLRSIQGKPLFPGTIITLTFPARFIGLDSDQDQSGFVGAFKNNEHYDGVYILRRHNRFIMHGCCQNGVNSAPENTPEHDYIVMLYSIYRYKIAGEILTFYDEPGKEILQFRKLPDSQSKPTDLYGKSWQLVSASTLSESETINFTLRFAEQKPTYQWSPYEDWHRMNLQTFDGNTPCQDYTGSYYPVENLLAVSSLDKAVQPLDELTEQALIALENDKRNKLPVKLPPVFDSPCGRLMILQKDRYFDLLKHVWRYEVSGTQLKLYSGQDDMLIFKQARNSN